MEEKKKKKDGRGGKRAGAGRKKGSGVKPDDVRLSSQVVIRVRSVTYQRIKQLRELTKQDTMPFVAMFESWVEEMAKDYGID